MFGRKSAAGILIFMVSKNETILAAIILHAAHFLKE